MMNGHIIKSGNIELVREIENKGYEEILKETGSNEIKKEESHE